MSAEKKVPAIRFKGFSGEWEDRKLEDFLTFKNGINARKEQYGKGLKFINVLDIINNRFITNNIIIGLVDVSNDVFEKNKVEYGDILFQRSSETREEVGQSNVYLDKEKNATFGGFVIRGKKIGEYDPVFFNFLLKTSNVRKEITTQSGGSTRYNVGQNTLKCTPIYITEKQEQTKIGEYFQQLDSLIAQHQQKHDKLLNLKKALLEKMFPKQGATEPAIRFKGFSGAWEEKVLGDITESYSGGTPQVGNEKYYKGDIPFIRSAEINKNTTELFISGLGLENSSARLISKGCILYALYGATSGEVGIAKINGAINQAILAITPHSEISVEFIRQWLRKNKSQIISTYLQGGQGNLSGGIVKSLVIAQPHYEEQTKIGTLFKHLDTLITQHQAQLNKLNNIKQACLAKMFV